MKLSKINLDESLLSNLQSWLDINNELLDSNPKLKDVFNKVKDIIESLLNLGDEDVKDWWKELLSLFDLRGMSDDKVLKRILTDIAPRINTSIERVDDKQKSHRRRKNKFMDTLDSISDDVVRDETIDELDLSKFKRALSTGAKKTWRATKSALSRAGATTGDIIRRTPSALKRVGKKVATGFDYLDPEKRSRLIAMKNRKANNKRIAILAINFLNQKFSLKG